MNNADRVTRACHEHETTGCQVCMVDDFHHGLDAQRLKRKRTKLERATLTIEDKYDLGGEG